ncbi:MAG: cytochrome C oxidase subunit IV family protein [Deltaproteobacteria bacterium]
MAGHIVSRKVYFMVFASLLVLTALTTLAAYVNLDAYLGIKFVPMNTIVALAIALCKATLVALFFMHVKYSSQLTKLAVVAGIFWLAILIALTLSDYKTRMMNLPNPPETWQTSNLR